MMKPRNIVIMAVLTAQSIGASAQGVAAHFDMSMNADGQLTESVSGQHFRVESHLPAFTVAGVTGEALRFDGYSNYVKAAIPASSLSKEVLTLSVVLAAETYPMMKVDVAEAVPTYATICGNLNEEAKQGLALELSSQGDLRLRFGSASGFLLTADGKDKLPRGRWCLVSAVFDKAANKAAIYLNGREIGSARMSHADIAHSSGDFYIGKNQENVTDPWTGKMFLNAFCGLIDDIRISNKATDFTLVDLLDYGQTAPDFNYPAERYAASLIPGQSSPTPSLWRPKFHAMPSGAWTNESHGMTYADGRYHLFFQKNANGPYMSRLHWGHVSSENLYDWREEPIAVAPGEAYDIKGCWSGCVYEDCGTHYILYTAVDNTRATIAQAKATDETLVGWQKQGIVINGRPAGLSDDFRDPYFFTAGGQKYIIVGTSKNGIGACTLHRYENGMWTNDGKIFFQGGNANQHGTFWEMPNVTPMGDGRWLFTCTPLGTGVGVRTLCWVGTIAADGTFQPDATGVQYLEMGGISRDGYGLLSPTIYKRESTSRKPTPSPSQGRGDQTGSWQAATNTPPLGGDWDGLLLLGIVPDKLPTQTNYEMGWAHNMSLPREISLAADGTLIQNPYSGLAAMRTQTSFSQSLTLQGTQSLDPVEGRQLELCGDFTVGSGQMGFRFLQSGSQAASLTYDADRGTITLDLTDLNRTANDNGVYNGIYTATLPAKPTTGETLRLHLFLDGSIADIFVGNRWAFSVRLFPTDASAVAAEAFATMPTAVKLQAWTLDAAQSGDGIMPIHNSQFTIHNSFFDLQGRKVNKPNQKGIYIQGGRKVLNKYL